jgi:hypothetical protein
MSTGDFVSCQPFQLPIDARVEHPPGLESALYHSVHRVLLHLGKQENVFLYLMNLVKYTESQSVNIYKADEAPIAVVSVYDTRLLDIRLYRTLNGVQKTLHLTGVIDFQGVLEIKLRVYDEVPYLNGIQFNENVRASHSVTDYMYIAMMNMFDHVNAMQDWPVNAMDAAFSGLAMDLASRKRGRDADDDFEGVWAQRPRGY